MTDSQRDHGDGEPTVDGRLVVPADPRYIKRVFLGCVAFVFIGLFDATFVSIQTRPYVYLSIAVAATASFLGILRLRMARFPQLVADERGFTVATIVTRRSFSWDALESIEPAYFLTPLGRQRTHKPRRSERLVGIQAPRQFRFRAGGRMYAVMSPPPAAGDLAEVRDKFERMWLAFKAGTDDPESTETR